MREVAEGRGGADSGGFGGEGFGEDGACQGAETMLASRGEKVGGGR
jgi:hypothetical protein